MTVAPTVIAVLKQGPPSAAHPARYTPTTTTRTSSPVLPNIEARATAASAIPASCVRDTKRCSDDVLVQCDAETGRWTAVRKCEQLCREKGDTAFCAQEMDADPAAADWFSTSLFSELLVAARADDACPADSVRCADADRVEICIEAERWEDYGDCHRCRQLHRTAVNCSLPDDDQVRFSVGPEPPSPAPTLEEGELKRDQPG
ncbi:hypothetical protein GGR52DRAFT_499640 [Hypoxylon sp. FL1284]|nr:hypothetical protein GGR52DRAFT_499640 [Hypoxylon sp. FL1284]